MNFSDLRGHQVVVWGYGREGRAIADHLDSLGVDFAIAEPDREAGTEANNDVSYGATGRDLVMAADVAIKSPGIPVTSELYRDAVAAGVRVTSLTDLWMHDNAARTIAVTGTKGKSTTSSLLTHILIASGIDASLRGNIGTPVLAEPEPASAVVVMELSSYQGQSLTISPRLLIVTSLFPEHLTWHGSEEAYYADKLNAAAHGPDVVVVPGADAKVQRYVARAAGETPVLKTGTETVDVDAEGNLVWADGTVLQGAQIPLIGRHQIGNAALAALAAAQWGITPAQIAAAIATYVPLSHRMELLPSADHRRWIDDSLATAPEAVVATLEALPGEPIAVLLGGADRGLDFTVLCDFLALNPRVTPLLLGPSGRRIHAQSGRGELFDSFAEAAAWARSDANTAGIVLLSPGAPSFDEFADYEARSAAFRAAANVVQEELGNEAKSESSD